MSVRFSFAFSRRLSASLTTCLLSLSATPALAQTVADPPQAPLAPEPPLAPPAPDAPAPAPSEPAPPSQAPASAEPTPAPTPDAAASPAPANVAPAVSPGSSAAFAPTKDDTAEKPRSKSRPPAAPAAAAATAPATAAATTPAPAASQSTSDPAAKDDDNSGGLLGPFRIGVLVGTGLPEVVSFGAQLKLTRFFGAGVNVGLIPTVKINYYGDAQQKFQEYDAYGHIYPFGGAFFLGAGVGYAQIDGVLINRINLASLQQGLSGNVDVTSSATVRTLVLTPQIGFLKIFDVGFAVGFDVGAQIPIAPSEVHFNTVAAGLPPELENEARTRYINPNDEKVRHTLDTVGRTPLPTFNFKIGWFL